MKLSIYNSILESFHATGTDIFVLRDVAKKYSQYSTKTLGSIYSQDCQRKMKRTHHRHYQLAKMDEYYFRYCEESQRQQHAMLHMARQVDLSPAMMARLILERYLAYSRYSGNTPPKSVTTQFLKDTTLIDDVRLAIDIDVCLAADNVYGPVVDVIKHSVGHEHELLLKRRLDEADLAYFDETQLRARGYDKTPDFILQVPVAVDGRVVNWIESKASFGDEESHANYLKEQFWSYWNRFGSGLVIYWFGFIDELDVNRDKGIMLLDCFPDNIVTLVKS
jgi:hypothetical protein